MLRDTPDRHEKPSIYHLDVAAMYPNIILTNRLQPCAIVNEADCAACVHNTDCSQSVARKTPIAGSISITDSSCQRTMEWVWRGDYFPATMPEYQNIRAQLEYETFSSSTIDDINTGPTQQYQKPSTHGAKNANGKFTFSQLSEDKQNSLVKQRLKSYCQSVYRRVKVTEEQKRAATVCMRENPFYVNTVRAFRDRRYDYKILTKQWKKKQNEAEKRNGKVVVMFF